MNPQPTKTQKTASGLQALAAALARLRAAAAHEPPEADPPPGTAWERAAERRLGAIEKALSSQNRLLLLTLVSVAADVVLGLSQ
ncbi:MAG: hypothetical protein IT317_17175 [Anaerolineales bacterium]|nr:hypothetical protein [Anaerolineales bacterium]